MFSCIRVVTLVLVIYVHWNYTHILSVWYLDIFDVNIYCVHVNNPQPTKLRFKQIQFVQMVPLIKKYWQIAWGVN